MKKKPPPTSPPFNHNKNNNNPKSKPAFSFIKVGAKKMAAVFSVFLFWQRKATPKEGNIHGQPREISDNSTGSSSKDVSSSKYSNSYSSSKSTTGQVGTFDLSFQEIYKATGNFSVANKIGEGGFGTVYKAKLKDGSIVAVKRAKKVTRDMCLSTEFKNEVLALSKIEHQNLVKLLGYLEHGDEQIIVVEYFGNGNLREHLDGTCGNQIEMAERLDIAIDVAHALTYLHMYTDPPIIHRDVKSSNILITDKFHAKVADFGFARLAVEDSNATHISTQVKGTSGYLDPEYVRTYQLTEKSDVYSFGVLLVEMMSGRYPIELKRNVKERVTSTWAMQKLKEGDAILVMDPIIRRSPASVPAVEQVLKLARHCLAPSRQSRPSMKKCAEVLWKIRKDFKEKSLPQAACPSYLSANIVERDARKGRQTLFGIEDSDNNPFRSA